MTTVFAQSLSYRSKWVQFLSLVILHILLILLNLPRLFSLELVDISQNSPLLPPGPQRFSA